MIPIKKTENESVFRIGKYVIYRDHEISNEQADYFLKEVCGHCKLRKFCNDFYSLRKALNEDSLTDYRAPNLWLAKKEECVGLLKIICKNHLMTPSVKLKAEENSKAL